MLYEKVKAIAEKQGFSISQLEKQSGIGNGTIRKWNEATPNLGTLKKLSETLKVPIETFLES